MAGRGVSTVARFAEDAVRQHKEPVARERRLAASAARDPRRVEESVTAAEIDATAGVPLMRYTGGLSEEEREYIALRQNANIENGVVQGALGGQVMVTERDWDLRSRAAKEQEVERRDNWIRANYITPDATPEKRKAARAMFPDFFEREAEEIERMANITKLAMYANLHGVDNVDGLSPEECVKLGRFLYGSSQRPAMMTARRTLEPARAPRSVLDGVVLRLANLWGNTFRDANESYDAQTVGGLRPANIAAVDYAGAGAGRAPPLRLGARDLLAVLGL